MSRQKYFLKKHRIRDNNQLCLKKLSLLTNDFRLVFKIFSKATKNKGIIIYRKKFLSLAPLL
ncbi:hypothetical protein, partial [Francisella tularensis]|uniref:hypothetical protein n=1 Tax=Francisella tularensis TaxID=263 RepID=UPI001F2557B5